MEATPAKGFRLTTRNLFRSLIPFERSADKWLTPKILTLTQVVLIGLYVLLGFNSHFWLDETISYWTTNGGIGEIAKRCTIWPHSILYSLLILCLRSLGATQPWLYRLPSFLGVIGATVILFHLTRRLFTSPIAWLAVAIFASLQPVQFAAGDARPYGLGLLAVVLSTELLLRLVDRPSYGLAASYGIVTGLMLHLHMLFGTMLAVHCLYLLGCFLAGRRLPVSQLTVSAILVASSLALLAVQYRMALADAKAHSFMLRASLDDLLGTFFPRPAALALLIVGVVLLLAGRIMTPWLAGQTLERVLVVVWALAPPMALFAFSKVSAAQVFVPRYLLPYAPGFAMFLAVWISSLDPGRLVSRILVVALIGLTLLPLRQFPRIHHAHLLGDWCDALAFVDRETAIDHAPVLLRSQFPESDSMPLEPVTDNPLFAQLTFYPSKTPFFPLSRSYGDQATRLDEFLATRLNSFDRFLFVFHGGPGSAEPFIYYLLGRLGPKWQMLVSGDFDGVTVTEFHLVAGGPKRDVSGTAPEVAPASMPTHYQRTSPVLASGFQWVPFDLRDWRVTARN
jgi:hypothetical protein